MVQHICRLSFWPLFEPALEAEFDTFTLFCSLCIVPSSAAVARSRFGVQTGHESWHAFSDEAVLQRNTHIKQSWSKLIIQLLSIHCSEQACSFYQHIAR